MLLKTSQLLSVPIMSLQTGEEVAQTGGLIMSPETLRIIGFELQGKNLIASPSFLRIEDIRELSNIGFIIDSSDEFVELDDVIAIRNIYELNFQLEGMRVVDTHGKKVGRVQDCILSTDTFTIEQLSITKPLFQSFGDTELLINRRQIVEINRDTITVKTPTVPAHSNKRTDHPAIKNPFRKDTLAQPETIHSKEL